MPLQPIVPLTDPSKNAQVESFFADGQKNQPGPHQLPFENYLQQALVGVNDSVINMAQGYQRVLSGDVNYLHQATLAENQTEVLLKLATAVASKITSNATTLFQMQF